MTPRFFIDRPIFSWVIAIGILLAGIIALRSLPVDSLLDWLRVHYSHLQDATLLRLFHDLQHDVDLLCEPMQVARSTDLQAIRVLHFPHRISVAS